ncbi:hypothetical protein E1A91_D11G350800v1 [Gossypium mustelinum]|uniref:Uncharacterized protein n=1 Tax=Gossypium mustelinum TaxID=34275 RepID=A0A5D2T2J3_GOSMU|nr:hypothetical protein E1A91_D11G350800v1 [Gossypium mustelinum]
MSRFFSNLPHPGNSGDSNFLHDKVGDRLVPPVLKGATEAISTVHQTVHGVVGDVAAEIHSHGIIKPILSDAISAAHGVATELQHAGTDVSSEAISAAQMSSGAAGGGPPQVQHSGLSGTASGLIKQISSDAISAAQTPRGFEGGSPQAQPSELLGTASGFIKQVSSDAISVAQMSPGGSGEGSPQAQNSGLLGTASGFIKQVSSDAISTAQSSPGVATKAQHSGLFGAASGLIKQVSSDAISAAHNVATDVQHAGLIGESLSNIDRLAPPVIKNVSSKAISAVQNVPGVVTEVGNGGLLNTATGFLKEVSSDAISAAQGVATEVHHVGAIGESLAKIDNLVPSVIKQVSSEAISANQKVAGVATGLGSLVQHGGILSTASGLVKDVSSQAIPAAQGVVSELKHGGVVKEETEKLKYLAFLQLAIIHVILWFGNLYTKLKQMSGPLKPVIEIVERMVKTLIGPIFKTFFDSLYDLFKFADDWIGEFVTKIDGILPPVIKQAISKVTSAANNALGLTVDVPTMEVQSTGVKSTSSRFLQQISSGAILVVEGVASQAKNSGLIPEELQVLKYLKYLKYFVTVQAAVLRAVKFYFQVKKMLRPLRPVIDFIERVVVSVYQKIFAKMFKSLFRWVLVNLFGVPAGVFDIIDKVGGDLSKLGDLSNLGDLCTLGDFSTLGGLSKLGDLSKIDDLVPSGALSAVQSLPGVGGLATGLPGTGLLSSASGLLKQVSSNAIPGAQMVADVQHAGTVEATTKIDSLISPLFKRSSKVTSVAQKTLGMATSSATGFIKQISSGAISAAQKAPRVAQGLSNAGVQNTGSLTQLASKPIAATQKPAEVQHSGVVKGASTLAKSVFTVVEPTVEKCAVSIWQTLNKIPLFPQVASVVVPTAAFFTDKYNQTVATGAEKGYKVASILPVVPTQKIAKVFSVGKSD